MFLGDLGLIAGAIFFNIFFIISSEREEKKFFLDFSPIVFSENSENTNKPDASNVARAPAFPGTFNLLLSLKNIKNRNNEPIFIPKIFSVCS